MKKRSGLRPSHAQLVIDLLKNSGYPLGANHIKDRLWDKWGRNVPTPREIGTFLNLHPNFIRVEGCSAGAEYIWED